MLVNQHLQSSRAHAISICNLQVLIDQHLQASSAHAISTCNWPSIESDQVKKYACLLIAFVDRTPLAVPPTLPGQLDFPILEEVVLPAKTFPSNQRFRFARTQKRIETRKMREDDAAGTQMDVVKETVIKPLGFSRMV